jgi:hypothetical protein
MQDTQKPSGMDMGFSVDSNGVHSDPSRGWVGLGSRFVGGVRNILDLSKRLEHSLGAGAAARRDLMTGTTGAEPGETSYDRWVNNAEQHGALQRPEETMQAIKEDPDASKGAGQGDILPYLTGGGTAVGMAKAAVPKAWAAAAPRLTNILTQGGGGGILAASTDPNNPNQTSNVAKGTLTGMILPAAAETLGAAARPVSQAISPAWSKAVDILRNNGIPVDAAQATGSKAMQLLRRYLSDSPGGHNTMEAARENANKAYTSAQLQNTGEAASTEADPNAILSRVRQGLDSVAARAGVQVDMPMLTDLAALEAKAPGLTTPDGARTVMHNVHQLIDNAVKNGGVVPGPVLQVVRGNLGKLEGQPATAAFAEEANNVLTDHFNRQVSGTPLAAEWATLRNQYKNAKVIQNSLSKDMEGQIVPSRVTSQLSNQYNKSRNTPQSTDPFVQTARAYNQVTDKFPNSGTGHRTALQTLGQFTVPEIIGGAYGAFTNKDHPWQGAGEGALAGGALSLGALPLQRIAAGRMVSPGFSNYFSGNVGPLGRVAQEAGQIPAKITRAIPGLSQAGGAYMNSDDQQYAAGGKVEKTMHEFKNRELHSGSKTGKIVRNRKQAIAIALNQQRKANAA